MAKSIFALLRAAFTDFNKRSGLTLAAALSFYTVLSISPLVVLLLWFAQLLGLDDQERLIAQVSEYTGAQSGEFLRSLLENVTSQPSLADFAGIMSFGLLLISAAGVFGQLQSSLNSIWNIAAPPKFSLLDWLKRRAAAMSMIFLLGLFIVGSIVTSSATGVITAILGGGAGLKLLIEALNTGLSLVLFSLFFAALFRYLPDTRLSWVDVRLGGFLTAVMFVLGKVLIGLYLAHSSVSSAFGAAGSLAAFLVWVYYSAAIFLFGAELTQQLAQRRGDAAAHPPLGHAVPA